MLRRIPKRDPFSPEAGGPSSPFDAGSSSRPIRLLVDLTTAERGEPLDLVRSFAHHPGIEVFEYDGGKPAPRTSFPDVPARQGAGEVLVGDEDEDAGIIPVEAFGHGKWKETAVWSRGLGAFAQTATGVSYDDAKRALALCWAAEQIGCHALVTGSPALLGGMPERIVERGNPMTAADACWLIGLYLRSKDDYTWEIGDHHSARVGRWIFFYGVTRELLPDSWRWFSGAAYHKPAHPRGDLVGLAMSGIERFDRALRARDRLHVMPQQGGGVNETDEEMFALDVMLLMLSGSFDVTALIANRVYGLSVPDHRTGWRQRQWRDALRLEDRVLADLMEPPVPGADALELVALMRNTVHGEALRSELHQQGSRRGHRVRVPDTIAQSLVAAARRLGDPSTFGFEELSGLGIYVDPAVYAESVPRVAADTLNKVMAGTRVELLVDDPNVLLTGPPNFPTGDAMADHRRARYRLLAGL